MNKVMLFFISALLIILPVFAGVQLQKPPVSSSKDVTPETVLKLFDVINNIKDDKKQENESQDIVISGIGEINVKADNVQFSVFIPGDDVSTVSKNRIERNHAKERSLESVTKKIENFNKAFQRASFNKNAKLEVTKKGEPEISFASEILIPDKSLLATAGSGAAANNLSPDAASDNNNTDNTVKYSVILKNPTGFPPGISYHFVAKQKLIIKAANLESGKIEKFLETSGLLKPTENVNFSKLVNSKLYINKEMMFLSEEKSGKTSIKYNYVEAIQGILQDNTEPAAVTVVPSEKKETDDFLKFTFNDKNLAGYEASALELAKTDLKKNILLKSKEVSLPAGSTPEIDKKFELNPLVKDSDTFLCRAIITCTYKKNGK